MNTIVVGGAKVPPTQTFDEIIEGKENRELKPQQLFLISKR